MRRARPHGRKARGQHTVRANAPCDALPGGLRQRPGQRLCREWLVLRAPSHPGGWAPASAPGFGRQRCGSWGPQARRGLNAQTVAQAQSRQRRTEGRVDPVSGICQNEAGRHPIGQGRPDLIQRDLWLGLEADILGHAGLAAPLGILGPGFRQVEAIGHRQTGLGVGHRERHGNLAVVLFADLTAVLPSHPDRVAALLGKAGIIDDPGLDRALTFDHRQDLAADPGQQSVVRPFALGHEVMCSAGS